MRNRKLTSDLWGKKTYNLEQIKKIIAHWLLPVPAEKFARYDKLGNAKKNTNNVLLYSDQYLKDLYLKKLLHLKRIDQIQPHLAQLSRPFEAEALEIFMCSKLALSFMDIVYPLINYIDCDEWASNLWHNYKIIAMASVKNTYYVNKKTSKRTLLSDLFVPVTNEDRLTYVEYNLLSKRYDCHRAYKLFFCLGMPLGQN